MSEADRQGRAHCKLLPGTSRAGDSVCDGSARDTNGSSRLLSPPSTLIPTEMARKGRKTRWRKLPIPLTHANQGKSTPTRRSRVPVIGGSPSMEEEVETEEPVAAPSKQQQSRVTFNEDEYTKITTPRQDIMFKKGYLGKKKPTSDTTHCDQSPTSPSESAESCEVQYVENGLMPQPYLYPSGYIDHNGLFYLNSGSYEVYEPYTGNLTVIVPGGYTSGIPGPMYPVPIPPVEWYPAMYPPQPAPQPPTHKKRNSTDSQNWGSSCESPSSPQEVEPTEPIYYSQPFPLYPTAPFVFPAAQQPVFPANGMVPSNGSTIPAANGAIAQPTPTTPPATQQTPPDTAPKRRKKRRKKRRPGMGEEGSESSCEEAGGGGSSDEGQGSSCSKTTDSGIHTAASGADSPQPQPPSDDASDEHWQPARGTNSPTSGSVTPVTVCPISPVDPSLSCPDDNSIESQLQQSTASLKAELPTNPLADVVTPQEMPEIKLTETVPPVAPSSFATGNISEDELNCLNCVDTCVSMMRDSTISPIPESLETVVSENGECDTFECVLNEDHVETLPTSCDIQEPESETVDCESAKCAEPVPLVGEKELHHFPLTNDNIALNPEERLNKVQTTDLTVMCEVSSNHSIEPMENVFSIIKENGDLASEKSESIDNLKFSDKSTNLNQELTFHHTKTKDESITKIHGSFSNTDEVEAENSTLIIKNIPEEISSPHFDKEKTELSDLKCVNTDLNHEVDTKERSHIQLNVTNKEEIVNKSQFPELSKNSIECIQQESNVTNPIHFEEPSSLRIEKYKQESTKVVCPRDRIDSDEAFDAVSEVRWSNAEENGWVSNESESPKSQPLSIETEEVWGLAEEWAVEALPDNINPAESKPLTEAVTKWLETNWPPPPQPPQPAELVGTEENAHSLTGPKNAEGNPFLALYPSVGTRVASIEHIEEYTGWVAERCKPADWVSRYYHLARSPSPTIHGPFPCGLVCCILQ